MAPVHDHGHRSVLGFLVSRAAYRPSMLGPVFIALSLSFGTAIFALVLHALQRFEGRPMLTPGLPRGCRGCSGCWWRQPLLHCAATPHRPLSGRAARGGKFPAVAGRAVPLLLWGGFVIFGSVLPMMLLFDPLRAGRRGALVTAAAWWCSAASACSTSPSSAARSIRRTCSRA